MRLSDEVIELMSALGIEHPDDLTDESRSKLDQLMFKVKRLGEMSLLAGTKNLQEVKERFVGGLFYTLRERQPDDDDRNDAACIQTLLTTLEYYDTAVEFYRLQAEKLNERERADAASGQDQRGQDAGRPAARPAAIPDEGAE